MKSIELTEEHKSKLLEMCKALFPEYNLNSETGYGGLYFGEGSIDGMLIGYLHDDFNDSIDDPNLYIHWFEFCVNYLPQKMGLKFFNYTRWTSEEGYIHLVDYLHIQWKKLSQQQKS